MKNREDSTRRRFKPIHHHIKHHYGTYKNSPVGIKILVLYSIILAVLYFIFSILFPTTIVFGHELTGLDAQFLNLLFFVMVVAMIFGFVHKTKWVWEFAMIWYILSLVSSFFAIITRASNILSLLSDSILLSSLVIFFINGLTIWYIYVRKDYFKHNTYKVHDDFDKIFIHFMTIFFVIALLSTTLVIMSFYQNTTKRIDNSINTLRGSTLEEALFICSDKDQPDRDICFLTIAVIESDMVENDVCNLIFSNFYRLTCFEALS